MISLLRWEALGWKDLTFVNCLIASSPSLTLLRAAVVRRNGTPRQPLLVPLAKAHLVLSPGGVPHQALDGLAMYSHCWLLYVFHENTDLPRLWSKPAHRDLRAKVSHSTLAATLLLHLCLSVCVDHGVPPCVMHRLACIR